MIEDSPTAHLIMSSGTALVTVIALLVLLWQIAIRRSIRVSVVGAVAGACGAMVFMTTQVRAGAFEMTGILDASRLVAHSAILFAGYAGQMIFVGMIQDQAERKRRHQRLLVALVIGVAVLAACVLSDRDVFFDARHVKEPAVAVYLIAFLTFLGWAVIGVALQAHRRARELSAPSIQASRSEIYLRAGLRVLSLIGPVGGAYVLSKIVFIGLTLAGSPAAAYESYFGSPLSQLSVLIALAGVTIPMFGPPIDNVARTIWAWRAHRRLEPLWDKVSGRRSLALPRGLRESQVHLHQRIAEIHDGLWGLQRWMPNGQLPRDPQHAAVAIDRALQARREGIPSSAEIEPTVDRPRTTHSEASWLVQVASSMRG